MARTHQWMKQPLPPPMLRQERINFYRYFSEYDRRRGTDFLKTFPEMAAFWEECSRLSEEKEVIQRGNAPALPDGHERTIQA